MKLAFASLALVGCAAGSGTVNLTAWGEEAATVGYPNQELAFADGWSLTYQHWITAFSNLELADQQTESVAFADATPYVADWTQAIEPIAVTSTSLAAARYKVSFAFVPATAGATKLTAVDDGLLATMVAKHWNTYFEATATKGAEVVHLHWGMHNPSRYQYCRNGVDDSDGIAVPDGGEVNAGIFVHLDHTFWDRLGSEEAQLRIEAIASWAVDGETALDDLSHVSIANLRDRTNKPILNDAGGPLRYDDAGLGLAHLREFIVFSTRGQAHLNGEGQCLSVPLD